MTSVNSHLQRVFSFSAFFFVLILEKKSHGAIWIETGSGHFHTWALLIAMLPLQGEKIEKKSQKSNTFGCTIALNKSLNMTLITVSCKLSSLFRNCPSSQLPALGNFGSCWLESNVTKRTKNDGNADHAHFPLWRPYGSSSNYSVAWNKFCNAAVCHCSTSTHEWNQTFIFSMFAIFAITASTPHPYRMHGFTA